MRKILALTIFDLGCALEWIGARLQGESRKHLAYIRWKQQIERKALKEAL